MEGHGLSGWDDYLNYLDSGTHSVKIITSNLAPRMPMLKLKRVEITNLGYTLWPFQKQILSGLGESTLILGLPTGLGKTYLAGAKLHLETRAGRLSTIDALSRANRTI